MSISGRRFEILLPLRSNDGAAVPDALIAEVLSKSAKDSGQFPRRLRKSKVTGSTPVYRDELVRVFVDVEDTRENREFFQQLRERIRVRFNQIAIWMTSHPIDIE